MLESSATIISFEDHSKSNNEDFFINPRILAKTNGKIKMLKQNFIKPNINKRPNISNPLLASPDLKKNASAPKNATEHKINYNFFSIFFDCGRNYLVFSRQRAGRNVINIFL